MAPPSTATPKLEAIGMDQIADWVAEGRSTRQIAEIAGCSQITLMRWLRSDMTRSARFDEALLIAAEHFEDRAIAYLDSAANEIRAEPELANPIVTLARERAQAAWRQASVRDPRRYSDRRGGDTYIDARKQALTAITIQTVKAGGGVRAGVGGSDEKVGVLPSDAAKLLPSSDAVVDAAPQKLELPELKVIRSDQWRKIGNIPDLEDL